MGVKGTSLEDSAAKVNELTEAVKQAISKKKTREAADTEEN